MLVTQYLSLIVAGIAIFLAIFLSRLAKQKQDKTHLDMQNLIQALEAKVKATEKTQAQLNEMLHEVRTGAFGLGGRLKTLESEIKSIQQRQTELINKQADLEQQEVSSPMYTRAAKLVASGASIEDIMEECDLPRAEAELLIALHRGK